jgi:hypothetical protein
MLSCGCAVLLFVGSGALTQSPLELYKCDMGTCAGSGLLRLLVPSTGTPEEYGDVWGFRVDLAGLPAVPFGARMLPGIPPPPPLFS